VKSPVCQVGLTVNGSMIQISFSTVRWVWASHLTVRCTSTSMAVMWDFPETMKISMHLQLMIPVGSSCLPRVWPMFPE
jgi:hypothetical protein